MMNTHLGLANRLHAEDETTDLSSITEAISDNGLGAWQFVTAAGILVGAVVVGRLCRELLKRVVGRSSADDFLGDLIGRVLGYLIVAFGLVYALESLGIAIAPILGALGVAGIALAFALQDLLENFVAGLILQMRRPFTAGDEIVVENHEGTVTSVDARTVTIRTPDGETVRLPSAMVIKNPIVNHTQNGRRRTTVDVGVAYGTDLDLATSIAREAAVSVDGVSSRPAPEAFVHTFGESSIDIAVRFWHKPSIAELWRVRDRVARAIDTAFADNDIVIPFPQRVVHRPPADD